MVHGTSYLYVAVTHIGDIFHWEQDMHSLSVFHTFGALDIC